MEETGLVVGALGTRPDLSDFPWGEMEEGEVIMEETNLSTDTCSMCGNL